MNKINDEFKDFTNSTNKIDSKKIDHTVFDLIQSEMNPSHQIVFTKILLIQSFVGVITLLFCPQFDFSLTGNYDLFHFFHRTFGHHICMMVCGALFVGSGAIFASYILTLTELRKIRESQFLYYLSLSGLFIFSFLIIGADVYLEIAALWSIGALIGGLLMIEINSLIRQKWHLS